jgi:hypothetical protein
MVATGSDLFQFGFLQFHLHLIFVNFFISNRLASSVAYDIENSSKGGRGEGDEVRSKWAFARLAAVEFVEKEQ